tara:strand:+ start:605 stop:1492 length:888 start_codon:yes stop_codon:yes gene_type:complete
MSGINFPSGYEFSCYNDINNSFNLNYIISEVETSFGYIEPYKLKIDFFPLFTSESLVNSHFLLFNKKIVGAIFCSLRKLEISNNTFTTACLGGIFIKEEYRGKGLFTPFFNSTLFSLQKKINPDLFLLWSENNDLYKRFNFEEMGSTYYEHHNNPLTYKLENFQSMPICELSTKQLNQVKSLYNTDLVVKSLVREVSDWKNIKRISSMNIFYRLSTAGVIEAYFIKDKGMDFNGIIHEFTNDPLTKKAIESFSKITPHKPKHSDFSIIPSALVKISNKEALGKINGIYFNGADCV